MLGSMFLNGVGLGVFATGWWFIFLIGHPLVNSLSFSQVLPTFREKPMVQAYIWSYFTIVSLWGKTCAIALIRPCEQITALKADDSVCE